MIKKNKKVSKDIKSDSIFEAMFESQVHEFVEQHNHLFEELNLFKMARAFEERYDYVITTATARVNSHIKRTKRKNNKLYNEIVEQRKDSINSEMDKMKISIEKSIKEHNNQNNDHIKKLNQVYKKNKEKLIDIILNEMEINF